MVIDPTVHSILDTDKEYAKIASQPTTFMIRVENDRKNAKKF